MHHVKKRIRLAPLTGPDQIDANKNPYELLNDLVNVAPLATFPIPTTTTTTDSELQRPPIYLLRSSAPANQHWSYQFSPQSEVLDLMITFSRRQVLLSEVQVFWDGEMDACPSNLIAQVSKNLKSGWTTPPTKRITFAPQQKWIWIQFEEPRLCKFVLLRIYQPVGCNFVNLRQIRLLEQSKENSSLEGFFKRVVQSKIGIPDLLQYCHMTLAVKDPQLLNSKALLARYYAVLVRFGNEVEPLLMESMETLTDRLLEPLLHEVCNLEVEVAMGLDYDLCTLPDERGLRNLAAGLRHLKNLLNKMLFERVIKVNGERFLYVRAFSSALWSLAEAGNGEDVKTILDADLINLLYKWSLKLKFQEDSTLKTVVDYLICSACYCRPGLFIYLMCSMDLFRVNEGTELNGCNLIDLLEQWYNDGSIWTTLSRNQLLSSSRYLDLNCLETLGRAAQSPVSAKILKESDLLENFKSEILEFCKASSEVGRYIRSTSNTLVQFSKILRFAITLSFVKDLRNVLGEDFWFPVLKFLSTPPPHLDSIWISVAEELEEMKNAMTDLMKAFCWARPGNQKTILPALKQVISKEKVISSFSRTLLEELLLEEEWTFVRVQSESKIVLKPLHRHDLPIEFHPSLGVKGRDHVFLVNTNTTAREILEMMEIKGSEYLHLKLNSRPNVPVPNHVSIEKLLAAAAEDPPETFLDMLKLTLSEDHKIFTQELTSLTALPSCLEVFSQNGGLSLLFQRPDPQTKVGIFPHIISALRRFSSLPLYTEVLLGKNFNFRTNYIIRLVIGLTTDADGNKILGSSISETLEMLPFEALNCLLEIQPSLTEQGRSLRRKMAHNKSLFFILASFDRLTDRKPVTKSTTEIRVERNKNKNHSANALTSTGSGEEEQVLEKKRRKEEKMICLLNILANVLNCRPGIEEKTVFPPELTVQLSTSTLIYVVLVHLRNDSVMDIAGHVPLYKAIFKLLRSLASVPQFWPLLVSTEGDSIISKLLVNMKDVIANYSQLLKASSAQDLDLVELLPYIQMTATQVEEALMELSRKAEILASTSAVGSLSRIAPSKTLEDKYVEGLKDVQFAFMEMIGEGELFKVPYFFESETRKGLGSGQRTRAKRLAQESVMLSTSLPLSYGSSIFMRCDNDRLDVIKVLITGSLGTPYSNGCFELDVFLPLDYPESPPKVNLETGRGKKIRFGPHIYTDGQICLTLLNTWEGDREERWDPKTSSLLPVLVAIQSVILAEDEEEESPEFYAGIRHLTLQYAILEQMRNPPAIWKEVMQRHFWLKRDEILAQCEQWDEWSEEMDEDSYESFEETLSNVKTELLNMSRPEGLEDFDLKESDNMEETLSTSNNQLSSTLKELDNKELISTSIRGRDLPHIFSHDLLSGPMMSLDLGPPTDKENVVPQEIELLRRGLPLPVPVPLQVSLRDGNRRKENVKCSVQ